MTYEDDFHIKKVTPSQYRGHFSKSSKPVYLNLELPSLEGLSHEEASWLKEKIQHEAKVLVETLLPNTHHEAVLSSDWLHPIFKTLGL